MTADKRETVTLAMTGASGAQYAWRLMECLVAANRNVFFMISKAAQLVSATETDVSLPARPQVNGELSDRSLSGRGRPDSGIRPGTVDVSRGFWQWCSQQYGDLSGQHGSGFRHCDRCQQ